MRCKGSGETHIWKSILPTRWGWGGYCCVFNRTKHDAYASPCALIDYLDLRYQSSTVNRPSGTAAMNADRFRKTLSCSFSTEPVLILYWKYQHSLFFLETFYLFIHVQLGTYIRTYTYVVEMFCTAKDPSDTKADCIIVHSTDIRVQRFVHNIESAISHKHLDWKRISKNILGKALSNILSRFCENRFFVKNVKKWLPWNWSYRVEKIENFMLISKI